MKKIPFDKALQAIPKPNCCDNAHLVVYFCSDFLTQNKEPGWYIKLNRDRLPSKELRSMLKSTLEVSFCPFCSEQLPEFAKRTDGLKPICKPDESHQYCEECKNRLIACSCCPPEAAYEILEDKNEN